MLFSKKKDTATPPPKRLYQVWTGSNNFFCGGRLIFGPDVASLFLSMLLITGPLIAFCVQIITKIHNTGGSKNQNQILGFPVLIVTILLMVADLLFLLLTSSRDPGIVPRNARPPDEANDGYTPSMEWVNTTSPHIRLPRTKDVLVNGFTVKVKYCDTCMLYRPPRASHCSICNNCVQKFDHHCPWVGQCIGLRNYRFFFLFISTSTFLCFYIFTFSWLNILEEKKNYNNILWKSMTGEVTSLVLIVYTFIAVWFVGGLTVFHLYLISTNQTTYENFRYRYDKKENPYHKGIIRNFTGVFFSKIPPSLNDFRLRVLEDTSEPVYANPNIGMEVVSFKEKIDLEIGNMMELGGDSSIPKILQNLDYSSIEDDLQEKNRHEHDASNSFDSPVLQEPIDQGSRDADQIYIEADVMAADGRTDQGSSTDRTATMVDHNDHTL